MRKLVLDRMHRECAARGLQFFMSNHFRERVNLRAHDQDEVFKQFLRAGLFILNRVEEFDTQAISIQISGHFFGFRPIRSEKKLVCLTYFYKDYRDPSKICADRKFILKEEKAAQ